MINKEWLSIRSISLAQACLLACELPLGSDPLSPLEAARVADERDQLLAAFRRGYDLAVELGFEDDPHDEDFDPPVGEDDPSGVPLTIDLREVHESRANALFSNELLRVIGEHNEAFIGQPTRSEHHVPMDLPVDGISSDGDSSDGDADEFDAFMSRCAFSTSPLALYTELDNDHQLASLRVSGTALQTWLDRRDEVANAARSPHGLGSDAQAIAAVAAFGKKYGLQRFELLAGMMEMFVPNADPKRRDLYRRGGNMASAIKADPRLKDLYNDAEREAAGALFVHRGQAAGKPPKKQQQPKVIAAPRTR